MNELALIAALASAQAQLPAAPKDPFEGVAACEVLDAQFFKPLTLEEAVDALKPCADAALGSAAVRPALLPAAGAASSGELGIAVATELVPGSPEQRGLAAALAKRGGRVLGHPARAYAKGQPLPPKPSALQSTLDSCMVLTVVRRLKTSTEFVNIYGSCLTREKTLAIDSVVPGQGMSVTTLTRADQAAAESYDGFVTVNAGTGPVHVLVKATRVAVPPATTPAAP